MSTLFTMIERGQFYETLGTDLGGGVCLVLGTSLPETHWTKLLTKTTYKRDRVIEHLNTNTPVPGLATQYQALQDHIVNSKVESLLVERSPFLGEGHETNADWAMQMMQCRMPHEFAGAVLDEIFGANIQ